MLWLFCMLLQDFLLQLWFIKSGSWIFFLVLFQRLWFLPFQGSFYISSPFYHKLRNKLLIFNWCELARDFKHTKRLLRISESSFVIKFTFHSLSVAIIPGNCSNLLQFLQDKISNDSHIVFNIWIVCLCSVKQSDSIVDLIFIRTTVKKIDCSIAWGNNYRRQTDSILNFDVVIVNSSKLQISIFDLIHIRFDCVSYFFEAVCCCHFTFSILLINHWI